MFNEIKKEINWNGGVLELSTGKIARQATGAVMVKMGDTIIQCTVVAAKEPSEGVDFFPLTVNYQEKSYAAGKIPGGFLKREGRGSEKEILVSRLIDRPIRPLFHSSFFNETNILCTVHSYDPKYAPDILALIGASAALAISGLPYMDIVAASRVGLIDGKFILNPDYEQLNSSKLDLVVAGTKDSVMMVESEADFLTEEQMLAAVEFGHKAFAPVIEMIEQFKQEAGKEAWVISDLVPDSLVQDIASKFAAKITDAFALKIKQERYSAIDKITADVRAEFVSENHNELQVKIALDKVKSQVLRNQTLESKTRIDGRALNQVRPIECEVGLFPRVHGSALFTRGETQAIVATTLGTGQDEQIMEAIEGEYKESFLLNYIFPQYSVGEVGPLKAPSRREMGHGKLGWRALKRALPAKADFPYTIRVVSEISESNGSSSMATVCGGSMSMMHAGIPLRAPISGIAMGLIKEQDQFVVLSDIIADEDHLGDMDFKVAGSQDGVTALQMDIKVAGITLEIMKQALTQAKEGRVHILEQMAKAIGQHGQLNEYAPVIESLIVPKDKIREIIGTGGKVIREICETTGAKIDISDEGEVNVAAVGRESLMAAVQKIKDIVFEPQVGQIFEGTVARILESGLFVNYLGSKDGFVHISEIAHERIENVASVLSEGQNVRVKLIGFERGKAQFTIKNVDNEILPRKSEGRDGPRSRGRDDRSGGRSDRDRPSRSDRGGRGERGDRGDRGDRGGRSERGDRGDRGDRGGRSERGERGDRGDRGGRSERGERGDRGDRGGRGERGERGDRGDRSERGERSERSNGSARSDRSASGETFEVPERIERTGTRQERLDNSEKSSHVVDSKSLKSLSEKKYVSKEKASDQDQSQDVKERKYFN